LFETYFRGFLISLILHHGIFNCYWI